MRVNGTITEQAQPEREPLTGSVDQVLDDLPALEELGVDEVLWGMFSDVDAQLRVMERLVKQYGA